MKLQGISVSEGIAIGTAFVFMPFKPEITKRTIDTECVETAVCRYEKARIGAGNELSEIRDRVAEEDEDKAGIFRAHIEILNDFALIEEITALIKDERYTPEYAVDTVYNKFIDMLSELDDDIIRERCADLSDVKNRIIRVLMGVENKNLSELSDEVIVIAYDLLPSDTATMNREKVLAFAAEIGATTSHSAIIARSYAMPAILGICGVTDCVKDGDIVILDALSGLLIVNPSEEELSEYTAKREAFYAEADELKKYQTVEPITQDGVRINVCLNIGSANDEELKAANFTDGVGLFRSEFLFMSGKELPTENQQYILYKKAVETFKGRQVILRTLDIGGDKSLECMKLPHEDNPFLGLRALRLCFKQVDLFKTQLRAALQASAFGSLAIMFPMVGSIEDFLKAKDILEECKRELDKENIAYDRNIKIGIMIEIPAIALIAELVVKHVDFASVGTNDLCQYLMAVDRLNPDVASYYQSYHPAMFKLISHLADVFNKEGKELSVCGEMGGTPMAAMVFMGLGIKKLSMVTSSVAGVKKMITTIDTRIAAQIAEHIKTLNTASEIEHYLDEEIKKYM